MIDNDNTIITVRKSSVEYDKWVAYVGRPVRSHIKADGTVDGKYCDYPTEAEAQAAADLYLEKQKPQTKCEPAQCNCYLMREFDGGATRDTTQGKLSYVKALSPIVLQRYVQYLDAHRLQPDGSMRDFDNWKKGIPKDVYFDGLGRHFLAVWLLQQGFPAEDNHGPVTLEDSLAAVVFNAMGWLHELVQERINCETTNRSPDRQETKPGYGGDVNA